MPITCYPLQPFDIDALCAAQAAPAEEFADRCSITLTLLLMLVATNIVASEHLPRLSYLTFIDRSDRAVEYDLINNADAFE